MSALSLNAPKLAVLAVALMSAVSPALAATQGREPIRGWSAMDGVETAVLLETAQQLPLSEVAVADQPYCASNDEIALTLSHDFNEHRIDAAGHNGFGMELWGSEQMGTWTLVAPRADATSCIIASGTGFAPDRAAGEFYRVAGLH